MSELSGFQDKLYWRQCAKGEPVHCFQKFDAEGGYVSLCGRASLGERVGGQAIERPPAGARCGRCDGLEMERRGWDESGPDTVDYDGTPVTRSRKR